jgi:hypothetical protein
VGNRQGDKSFAEKRKAYRESTFLITQEIAEDKIWGPKEITKRQENLSALAAKVWPL